MKGGLLFWRSYSKWNVFVTELVEPIGKLWFSDSTTQKNAESQNKEKQHRCKPNSWCCLYISSFRGVDYLFYWLSMFWNGFWKVLPNSCIIYGFVERWKVDIGLISVLVDTQCCLISTRLKKWYQPISTPAPCYQIRVRLWRNDVVLKVESHKLAPIHGPIQDN